MGRRNRRKTICLSVMELFAKFPLNISFSVFTTIASLIAIGSMELCGCESGSTAGMVFYTFITGLIMIASILRLCWIVYIYFNDRTDDDWRVGIVKAFDSLGCYLLATTLIYMLLWVWDRGQWTGIYESETTKKYGDFGFYRVFLGFFYMTINVYTGIGYARYASNGWLTELILSIIIFCNILVNILVLSASLTVVLNSRQKKQKRENGGDEIALRRFKTKPRSFHKSSDRTIQRPKSVMYRNIDCPEDSMDMV